MPDATSKQQRKVAKKQARAEKAQARKEFRTYMARLGMHFVQDGYYAHGTTKLPIAGAVAEYESGADKKRVTGTRVITGTVLFGPVGGIAGGVLRKNKTKCYVTITFADGNVVIIDQPIKQETQARKFAAKVNAASEFYANRV